jgi:hypothetical protein
MKKNQKKTQEKPKFPQFPYRGHIGPKPATPVLVLGVQSRRVRKFNVSRYSSRRPGYMHTHHLLVAYPDGRIRTVTHGLVQQTKKKHYPHWAQAWQEQSGSSWQVVARNTPRWARGGWPATVPGALIA